MFWRKRVKQRLPARAAGFRSAGDQTRLAAMWSMPRRALQIVAVLLVACAIGGFWMGFAGAPGKARLPGEDVPGEQAGTPLTATEATPLIELRDTAAEPKPEAKPEEEDAEEKKDEAAPAEVAAAAPAAASTPGAAPAAAKPAAPVADDKVGDLLDGVTPPPENPVY